MATKRRTNHDSQRKPDIPVVEAASTDQPSGPTGGAPARKEQATEKSTAAPVQDSKTKTRAGAEAATKARAEGPGEPGAAPEAAAGKPAPEPAADKPAPE